jgi:hypothetical protein
MQLCTVPFFNLSGFLGWTLGYNNFDFFDKMEPPRPEIDIKWEKIVSEKFHMGIIKCKIQCWFRIRWKSAKKFTQKSYRRKTFAHSNKSKKLHFSVTFLLITFFHEFFRNFFTRFNISIQFCVFWYPNCFFEEISFTSYFALFTNSIWMQTWTKLHKKRKNLSLKCVLELNVATINGLGEPSC